MSKHIKKFETEQAFAQWRQSEDCELPQLSWCVTENTIKTEAFIAPPHDYSQDYLTIVSTSDNNTIGWKTSDNNFTKTINVSTDNGQTWTDKTPVESQVSVPLATLNTGDKILIKGNNTSYGSENSYNYFTSTGTFNVEGNIMSMIYGDDFVGQTTLSGTNIFNGLFKASNIVNASNLILPATTLADYCYYAMFRDCTSLTTAPVLPATTLAKNCYNSMFYNCTSLTSAPALPATTLATYCYHTMFYGCTSLTTAPELPATTLATYCYNWMFGNCTSLTTAPVLPATTLTGNCYREMFSGCISLTTAPTLPATTLTGNCYREMFSGCTNLNQITCLATDISASNCLTNWVGRVAPTGTFIKDSSMTNWTTGNNGIPSGWTVQDAS